MSGKGTYRLEEPDSILLAHYISGDRLKRLLMREDVEPSDSEEGAGDASSTEDD